MDVLEFRNTYWNYYIQLENDFFSYSPYCEIDPCNDNAFSVKYLQLLLSVCGEIDSICKTFCHALDDTFKPDKAGIKDYISILRGKYPTFSEEKVRVLGYKYREVQPWEAIAKGDSPSWWKDYTAPSPPCGPVFPRPPPEGSSLPFPSSPCLPPSCGRRSLCLPARLRGEKPIQIVIFCGCYTSPAGFSARPSPGGPRRPPCWPPSPSCR